MPTLTADAVLGYRTAEPLEEDFEIAELGGTVHIAGIRDKSQYDAVQEDIARTTETAPAVLERILGYTPRDRDIVSACYAASCVTDPKLTSLQWLQFNANGYRLLPSIFGRCLVCSRLGDDKDDNEKVTIPNGIDAAKNELQDKEATEADPLGPGGSDTA